MENRKGSGIFLGVIGVATLVVAIIGATFAYFSATANSATNAVEAGSGSISLGFDDLDRLAADALIPAYDNIAEKGESLEGDRRCIDDNGNDICTVYEFAIANPSSTITQQVYGSLKVSNTFTNLYFSIYDVTTTGTLSDANRIVGPLNFNKPTGEGATIPAGVTYNDDGSISLAALNLTLAPSTTAVGTTEATKDDIHDITKYAAEDAGKSYKKFRVLVWIREIGDTQEEDMTKAMTAQINFTTGTGSGVSGQLSSITSGVNFEPATVE